MNQEDILKMAREAEPRAETASGDALIMSYGALERFAALVAAKAAQDEREAMKPAIIEALKAEEQEMENYSYFGSNRGVSVDDYEDVADAAISIRARGE